LINLIDNKYTEQVLILHMFSIKKLFKLKIINTIFIYIGNYISTLLLQFNELTELIFEDEVNHCYNTSKNLEYTFME